MAKTKPLPILRGNTMEFEAEIVDDLGTPINLTGCKFTFMIKKSVDDTDDQAIHTVVLTAYTDPLDGTTIFSIPAADTAKFPIGIFVYAVQLIDVGGRVLESESGQCDISADVIRATI